MGGWSSIECCQKYYLKSIDENEKHAVSILNGIFDDNTTANGQKSVLSEG